MKRLTWSQLSPDLRRAAIAKLNRIAEAKAGYDGTLMPYGWADRIAPLLRYTVLRDGRTIWDCSVLPADQKRGFNLFTLPAPKLALA